jgi:uncharacterized protein YoxC
MTPNEIFFSMIAVAFVALVIAAIWLIVKLVDAVKAARTFLDSADTVVHETADELKLSLQSLRGITDKINLISADVESFSGSIRTVGEEVQQITGSIKRIGNVFQNVGTETMASVCGLRAGIRSGLEVLVKNLFQRA